MIRRWHSSICGGLFLLAALACPLGSEAAQSPAQETKSDQPGESSGSATPPSVSVAPGDLARIRRALDSEPVFKIDASQLRFYVQITGRPYRTFAEFAKGYDFINGPTRRGNPMTHNEFLAMVTPREMQSQVGITARETLEFAFTNWLGQTLIRKAMDELKEARSEHEIQAIRDRIERELEMIRGAEAR